MSQAREEEETLTAWIGCARQGGVESSGRSSGGLTTGEAMAAFNHLRIPVPQAPRPPPSAVAEWS